MNNYVFMTYFHMLQKGIGKMQVIGYVGYAA